MPAMPAMPWTASAIRTVVEKLSYRYCQNYYIPYLAIKIESMKVALLSSSTDPVCYVARHDPKR